ncbi:MAG TPA: DUF1015 domain-containing protein [Bacteroidia bacterium]|jgi:uncharacterized protein (DUF1015 family)|nr:DUF1015 domain-containing protein [Bacteroidia bacterium]
MANILPFKGIRPAKDKVHLVASRSVDGYDAHELHSKLASNPYSFLHVISPDFSEGKKTKPGSPERLKKVKAKYQKYIDEHILVQDEAPAYYVYQQEKDEFVYTGIIACTSIDDYINGKIKIHEQTITDREEKLMHYLEVCDFNAEPVLFSYANDTKIDEITSNAIQENPDYDFTTTDKVRHKLWVINDPSLVNEIQERFKTIPHVYIADGHHRSASSALLGKLRRSQKGNFSGKEAFNYYLGVFFPETQLKIFDFNRVVKDLNGLNTQSFIEKLQTSFTVTPKGQDIYKPVQKHNFSMYIEGNWYSLDPKKELIHNEEPVGSLDASILSEHILSPILNIHDLKTDKRIGFVSGIKGMKELKNQVDHWDFKVAFGLYPVEMEQLKHIADTNNIMPPKTTWVEPKMRSGLVIYSLTDTHP